VELFVHTMVPAVLVVLTDPFQSSYLDSGRRDEDAVHETTSGPMLFAVHVSYMPARFKLFVAQLEIAWKSPR
jgi:hypothetical protein